MEKVEVEVDIEVEVESWRADEGRRWRGLQVRLERESFQYVVHERMRE
jgi:hypothetical protein